MDFTALNGRPSAPELSTPQAEEVRPLSLPHEGAWRLFREALNYGGPGCFRFGITHVCNARRHFCKFPVGRLSPRQRRSVPPVQARDDVAICASDAWINSKKGQLLAAARRLFGARHRTWLGAVWENRKWLARM